VNNKRFYRTFILFKNIHILQIQFNTHSNIIRPTPRNMKETTYDRKKKKINKELNKVKESDIKYWRHLQVGWSLMQCVMPKYCWQMSFSPICRNTMSHSGSKFFTTWRSKCFNEYWRHQSSWQKTTYFNRDGVHLNDDGHFKLFCSIRMSAKLYL
jgi:hypothetical protein